MKRQLQGTKGQANADLNKTHEEINQDIIPEEGHATGEENAASEDLTIASSSNGPEKKRKRYIPVWNHFSITNDGMEEWANCNYCVK